MPIFEFVCQKCNHQFEELFLPHDNHPVICPKCSGKNVTKIMSAGAIRPNGIPTGSGGFSQPSCSPAAGGG